jgi:hypothetical protein
MCAQIMMAVKFVSLLATLFIPGTDRNWNSKAIERNLPHGNRARTITRKLFLSASPLKSPLGLLRGHVQ